MIKERSEPFSGWRTWRLRGIGKDDPVLKSMATNFYWEGPIVTAHAIPQLKLRKERVGIHALSQRLPIEDKNIWWEYLGAEGVIAGTVDLFGRVVKGTEGYRASRALLTSIELRYNPCVVFYPWLFNLARKCKNETAFWCEYENGTTRPFCKEHANLKLPHMSIEQIANAFFRKYQCEVII